MGCTWSNHRGKICGFTRKKQEHNQANLLASPVTTTKGSVSIHKARASQRRPERSSGEKQRRAPVACCLSPFIIQTLHCYCALFTTRTRGALLDEMHLNFLVTQPSADSICAARTRVHSWHAPTPGPALPVPVRSLDIAQVSCHIIQT